MSLPVVSTSVPSVGYIVFDGVLRGILRPVFYVDLLNNVYGLHLVRPDADHIYFVDSSWQLSVMYASSMSGFGAEFIAAAGLQDWNLAIRSVMIEVGLTEDNLQFKALPV